MMRELRGQGRPVTLDAGGGRKVCLVAPSTDGIAGFFRLELESMRPFGSPRRTPGEAAAADAALDRYREAERARLEEMWEAEAAREVAREAAAGAAA